MGTNEEIKGVWMDKMLGYMRVDETEERQRQGPVVHGSAHFLSLKQHSSNSSFL